MRIPVEYYDANGTQHALEYYITKLGFVKHLAIAGQGYAPSLRKLMKTLGMLLHYNYYLEGQCFSKNCFSEPPIILSDPTEKGQFSNLAGRAIADFLSKRIDKSFLTISYEAAMRSKGMQIKGPRPDLLAYSKKHVFALEAKGYSSGPGNMQDHKTQANTGGIPVSFSIACVSHNLYHSIRCNYHDPINEEVPYDDAALLRDSSQYYTGLLEFLNKDFFEVRSVKFENELFFEVGLSYRGFAELFPVGLMGYSDALYYAINYYQPKLILPGNIEEYAARGISNEQGYFKPIEQEALYIDADGVGLKTSSDLVLRSYP